MAPIAAPPIPEVAPPPAVDSNAVPTVISPAPENPAVPDSVLSAAVISYLRNINFAGDCDVTAAQGIATIDPGGGPYSADQEQAVWDAMCSSPLFPVTHLPQHAAFASAVAGCLGRLPARQQEGATHLRKLLSTEQNPESVIDAVLASGVAPSLVKILDPPYDGNPKLQLEASWALTNIASGSSNQLTALDELGCVPRFVRLLSSPSDDVKEQCVWALGNIAGDSPAFRDQVIGAGAVPLLLLLLLVEPNSVVVTLLRNAAWTLSNVCRGKPQPDFDSVKACLPVLARLLNGTTDEETIADVCWALSYLSDGANHKIHACIKAGLPPLLVGYLDENRSASVVTPALRTVGNIVTGDDLDTQAVIDCGCIPRVMRLLNHQKNSIVKEACWTLSNITAGTVTQIQAILDAGCIPPLVEIAGSGDRPQDCRKEACWALTNATSGGSSEQMVFLIDAGTPRAMTAFADSVDSAAREVQTAVEGLSNMLKKTRLGHVGAFNAVMSQVSEANGEHVLEGVQQNHADERTRERAQRIRESLQGQGNEISSDTQI